MNYDSSSFDPAKLHFKTEGYKTISFQNHHRLFDLLLGYIASHIVEDYGSSYRMDVFRNKADEENENPLGNTHFGRILMKIGYGEYKFATLNGEEAYAVYQHLGVPVGSDCGPDLMQNLIIFTRSLENFGRFLSELITISEKPEEGKFVCYVWAIRHQYWREEVRVNNRPVQSVVLPNAMKTRLLHDVEKFLSQKTKDFYFRNGIPYRRSYLFHGVPGTGKTSMVQAIAGHFKRNVCFLMPTHPEMTDDNLREAIQSIPENSIVVLEDIDALFSKDRENKSNKSALTFSGLLNALDGIGSPNGQIFVLTTNLRENLDHALIRNGRVDLHVEFTYAVEEQMELMFSNFYPEATKELSNRFAGSVVAALKEKNLQLTTSALQHFFITQMEATPEEALAAVPSMVEELIRNSSASMLAAAKDKKKKDKKNNKKEKKERTAKREEESGKEQSESEGESDGRETTNEEFVVVGKALDLKTPPAGVIINTTTDDSSPEAGEGKKKKKKNRKNRKNRRERGEGEAEDGKEGTEQKKDPETAPKATQAQSESLEGTKKEEGGEAAGSGESKSKKKRNRKNKNRSSEESGDPKTETEEGKRQEVSAAISPPEAATATAGNDGSEVRDPLPKREKKKEKGATPQKEKTEA